MVLPVESAPLLGSLAAGLPLEVVRAVLHYCPPQTLLALGATSRGGLWLVDNKALWRVRVMGFVFPFKNESSAHS